MPGGRRTHDFPTGKPAFLTAVELAILAIWCVWLVGSERFISSVVVRYVSSLVVMGPAFYAYSQLMTRYERTGRAVRRRDVRTSINWLGRLPGPVLAVRIAFFVVVAAMLFLGFLPVGEETARKGIIASVLTLFAIGGLSVALEGYYVSAGRAKEIEIGDEPTQRPEH